MRVSGTYVQAGFVCAGGVCALLAGVYKFEAAAAPCGFLCCCVPTKRRCVWGVLWCGQQLRHTQLQHAASAPLRVCLRATSCDMLRQQGSSLCGRVQVGVIRLRQDECKRELFLSPQYVPLSAARMHACRCCVFCFILAPALVLTQREFHVELVTQSGLSARE